MKNLENLKSLLNEKANKTSAKKMEKYMSILN